eukprot:1846750-Pyramimonas_sp.AAC.1
MEVAGACSSHLAIRARRWQQPRCHRHHTTDFVLRSDAPAFSPPAYLLSGESAVAAYRSEPLGHTRSGGGLEMAGLAFNESEFDFCDFHYDSSF